MASAFLVFWLLGIAIAWGLVDQDESLDYTTDINIELIKVCTSMGSWCTVVIYAIYWFKNKID